MKKTSNRKQSFYLNIIATVLLVIFNVGLLYVLFNVTRYAAVSKTIFVLINIVALVIDLIICIISLIIILGRKNNYKIGISVILLLLCALSLYGSIAVGRVNGNIDTITQTGDTATEEIGVAFVTYNNGIVLDEDDIKGSRFGIIGNDEFLEGNILAKAELENKKINVTYVEYETYISMYMGLVNGDIDVAALPSNYYDLFIVNDGFEELLKETKTIYEFKEVVEVKNDFNSDIDITKDPFSVLIMGNDGGRTDTLILMTVNPSTMKVTMTSIPRDSYVPIACYVGQSRDKITHARTVSRQCTIDTVENLLDIDINFYVETNFKGVVDIVDALGGIQIDSPIEFDGQNSSDERGHYTVHIFKGIQTVNGEQALAFARERYRMPNGDYDRQKHQQEVIKAMIEKALEIRDINKLLNVLDAAGENIKTNMSVDQMTSMVNYVLKVVDSSYVKNGSVLMMVNSRITGYSSYYYNSGEQLPLWISIPWKGAIADAKSLIKDNLLSSEEKKLDIPQKFEYSITYYYFDTPVIADFYNEEKEVIDMPDFMPTMAYKYSIDDVRAWCSERGIALVANKIKAGDPDYDDNLAAGLVISQSYKYGTLVANIDTLEVSYIYKITEENAIPTFVDQPLSYYVNWCNNNGYSQSITWITSNDSGYVPSKVGYIKSQNVAAGEDKNEYTSVGISVYDYPYVTGIEALTTKSEFDVWAKNNLTSEAQSSVKISYVYSGSQPEGSIKSGSITWYNPTGSDSDGKPKSNSVMSLVVYTNDESLATKYTVRFFDANGNVISEQTVIEGNSAIAPENPVKEGFTFVAWDTSFSVVTSNLDIRPVFNENTPIEQPGSSGGSGSSGEIEGEPELTE